MRRTLIALAGALVLSAGLAAPAFAGPPWISIEIPVNPFNPATRSAFCLVRVYHHGDPAFYPVSGTAEGLIGGTRRSVSLALRDTGTPGLYAVNYQPAKDGTWLLVLRIGEDREHGSATVVVTMDRKGQITSARVPTSRRDNYDVPSAVTAADVDRMLREQAAEVRADRGSEQTPWMLAGLAFVPLALVVRRCR